MKRLIGSFLVLVLAAGFSLTGGCTNDETVSETGNASVQKPIVAVSIVPEQTFVEAVCGDLAEVITMVPPGSNPENYEPTPGQMEKFSHASLYFAIGVQTEQASILPNIGDVKLISLQEEVSVVYPDRLFASGERDPHIWLSPKRVIVMIDVIAQEMCGLDPDHADTYLANADAYIAKLRELDQTILASLEDLTTKKFIVYHPAFGYFADDYGLTMYALEEEGKESTAKHLQDMIDLAKAENIKVIFYQEEIDSSQSEAFAEEIGGVTMQLSPLAADYIANLQAMAEKFAEILQ